MPGGIIDVSVAVKALFIEEETCMCTFEYRSGPRNHNIHTWIAGCPHDRSRFSTVRRMEGIRAD